MIHKYKLNGYNIVLDTFSGSVHSVDDVCYDVIDLFGHCTEQEIADELSAKYNLDKNEIFDCIADVKELKEQGKLFSADTFAPIATAFKQKSGNVIKALCLHVAHTCNLNCSYCFASQGKYHGERAVMSFEVGKQALDFLIANSGTRKNLEVDFFGGEPLMNWQAVKDLVKYARSVEGKYNKNFRFTLTTNGVLVPKLAPVLAAAPEAFSVPPCGLLTEVPRPAYRLFRTVLPRKDLPQSSGYSSGRLWPRHKSGSQSAGA